MENISAELKEIKLIGIVERTSNEAEMDPGRAKIGRTIQKYFQGKMAEKIPNRKAPNITYCVYTNFENDSTGEYTYFIGEEVDSFDLIGNGFETLIIPAQNYTKFTHGPGKLPTICIDMWKKIWQMSSSELGGKRNYLADFEIYDERACDPENAILDIYIGVN